MDMSQEIAERVNQLPPELQKEVLHFVASLTGSLPPGEPGSSLLPFAGALDPDSARELAEAIADACESSDEGEW